MPTESTSFRELFSRGFNKTPHGLLFSNDIKTIFSIFLMCLDLKADSKDTTKSFFNAFTKNYPFSFSYKHAIEKMAHLEIDVEMNVTCINVSYSIKPSLAAKLLKIFMAANLLHTPADRTRSEPKEQVVLQPTPKGVAILHKYARAIGLKKIPPILLSDLNSMEIFMFERSTVSDSIIHSDYLIHILFTRMMGLKPNVWTPDGNPDELPRLSQLLDLKADNTFTFENMDYSSGGGFTLASQDSAESWADQLASFDLENTKRISPIAHRFFTNPDSDSHVQYYVSNKGLRLFQSKYFGKEKYKIDYCFTTKAIWQWLMDCTDILYPKEAVSVAALFLKCGLIAPILLPPSKNSKRKFFIDRCSFYTITKFGYELIQWNKGKDSVSSALNVTNAKFCNMAQETKSLSNLSISGKADSDESNSDTSTKGDNDNTQNGFHITELDEILKDPGMRYLFRRHLDMEMCAENLDSFFEIKKLLRKISLLRKIIDSHIKQIRAKTQSSQKRKLELAGPAIAKLGNECLELAYHIYSSYIMIGSPNQLNIDHHLREKITATMVDPQSPLSTRFHEHYSNSHIISDAPVKKEDVLVDIDTNKSFESKDDPILSITSPIVKGSITRPAPLDLNKIESDYITVKNHDSNSFFTTDESLTSTLGLLKKLGPLFEVVGKNIYELMKRDSLQKFLQSQIYREAFHLGKRK